jgi:hypothetical protein
LTISFVVLISTTYYQSLLLSGCILKDAQAPPLTMQEIVHNFVLVVKQIIIKYLHVMLVVLKKFEVNMLNTSTKGAIRTMGDHVSNKECYH